LYQWGGYARLPHSHTVRSVARAWRYYLTRFEKQVLFFKSMNQLTDREIRQVLLKRLKGMPIVPKAVLEEVRVHNGNAIADVVAVHRGPHCYEIKGESDAVQRIVRQGSFYDRAFQRITLVTTENHLGAATRLAPAHWGIMMATHPAGSAEPKLRYLRRASDSPCFDKQVALLTLWRCELISLCSSQEARLQKLSRQGLTQLLAQSNAARDINAWIGEKLADRHAMSGWSMAM